MILAELHPKANPESQLLFAKRINDLFEKNKIETKNANLTMVTRKQTPEFIGEFYRKVFGPLNIIESRHLIYEEEYHTLDDVKKKQKKVRHIFENCVSPHYETSQVILLNAKPALWHVIGRPFAVKMCLPVNGFDFQKIDCGEIITF